MLNMEIEVPDDFDAELEIEKRKISELYREIKGGNDDDKLNWMYKNPMEVVEREEYLLGRSVDKALDFISGKDDGAATSKDMSNMPKRLVTEANRSNKGQVDLQKKILEDPLFAIKQKEIDARKELLSNPVKMKEIKSMIDAEAKKAKIAEKRKKAKLKKSEMSDRINYLLLKRLKSLSSTIDIRALVKSVQEEESSEEEEKEEKKKSSKTRKDKTKRKENGSSQKGKRKKKDVPDSSESETKSRNRKKEKYKRKAPDSSEEESSDEKHSKKRKKDKGDSSDSESESENSIYDKYLERRSKKDRRPPPSSSSSETDSSNEERGKRQTKKQKSEVVSDSGKSSDDERRQRNQRRGFNPNRGRGRGGSHYSERDISRRTRDVKESGQNRGREWRNNRHSPVRNFRRDRDSPKGRNTDRRNRRNDRNRKSRSPDDGSDSDGKKEKRRYKPSRNWRSPDRKTLEDKEKSSSKKKRPSPESDREKKSSPNRSADKKYGLSTVDGSRPDTPPKEFIQEYSAYKKKEEKKKYVAPKPVMLTDEEKEAQLKAMMDNAKWHKKEQETDSMKYRKQKEKDEKVEEYDTDFVRKQVASLTSHGSVADRIKSNVNNIQRSSSSMSQNFVRK